MRARRRLEALDRKRARARAHYRAHRELELARRRARYRAHRELERRRARYRARRRPRAHRAPRAYLGDWIACPGTALYSRRWG